MTCHKVGQKFAGQQVVADGSYQSKLTDWNHMGLFVFRRPICKRRSDGEQTNLCGFDKTDWDKNLDWFLESFYFLTQKSCLILKSQITCVFCFA